MTSQRTHNAGGPTIEVSAADATWAARWEWQRLAERTFAERVALVADTVWQRGYTLSYVGAYTAVAEQVGDAATNAAITNPTAGATLHRLVAVADDAAAQVNGQQVFAPPADSRTRAAAQVGAGLDGGPQPWKPVAEQAWAGGVRAGAIAGALNAATDIIIGWRARGGDHLPTDVRVDAQPMRAWVADLLAGINRDTVTAAAGRRPAAAPTAAQLASQDQAPGVNAAPAPRNRREPTTPAAATTARSRAR